MDCWRERPVPVRPPDLADQAAPRKVAVEAKKEMAAGAFSVDRIQDDGCPWGMCFFWELSSFFFGLFLGALLYCSRFISLICCSLWPTALPT